MIEINPGPPVISQDYKDTKEGVEEGIEGWIFRLGVSKFVSEQFHSHEDIHKNEHYKKHRDGWKILHNIYDYSN